MASVGEICLFWAPAFDLQSAIGPASEMRDQIKDSVVTLYIEKGENYEPEA
jgi:hypothetical protein